MSKQVKLSKLIKNGVHVGYGLSVDGELLAHQEKLFINSTPLGANNSVTVTFKCKPSMFGDAPDVHLE